MRYMEEFMEFKTAIKLAKGKEGYMYGVSGQGSYWCSKCGLAHHNLRGIGKIHLEVRK